MWLPRGRAFPAKGAAPAKVGARLVWQPRGGRVWSRMSGGAGRRRAGCTWPGSHCEEALGEKAVAGGLEQGRDAI